MDVACLCFSLPWFAEPDGEGCSVIHRDGDFCPELMFGKEIHELEAKGLGRSDTEASRKTDAVIAYREEIEPVSFIAVRSGWYRTPAVPQCSQTSPGMRYLNEFVTSSLMISPQGVALVMSRSVLSAFTIVLTNFAVAYEAAIWSTRVFR